MDARSKASMTRFAIETGAELGLTPAARLLLGVLVAMSFPHDDGDGWAVEARATALIRHSGLGRSRMFQALAELGSRGLLRRTRTGRASIYLLTIGSAMQTHNVPPQEPDRVPYIFAPDVHASGHQMSTRPDIRCPRVRTSDVQPCGHQSPLYLTVSNKTSTTTTIRADGGGGGVRSTRSEPEPVHHGAGLDGNAAVCYELIVRKPEWYGRSDWIDPRTARELACLTLTTPTVVRAALAAGRARRDSLRPGGVPGWVISRIREPSFLDIEAERRRQREQAERDRISESASERRRREREAELAIAQEAERQAAARVEALGEEGLDAAIEAFARTTDSNWYRDLLWSRTTEERRRLVLSRGLLERVLEAASQEDAP
jgi:hypothetical protein